MVRINHSKSWTRELSLEFTPNGVGVLTVPSDRWRMLHRQNWRADIDFQHECGYRLPRTVDSKQLSTCSIQRRGAIRKSSVYTERKDFSHYCLTMNCISGRTYRDCGIGSRRPVSNCPVPNLWLHLSQLGTVLRSSLTNSQAHQQWSANVAP